MKTLVVIHRLVTELESHYSYHTPGDDHREGPLQSLKRKAIDDYEEEEEVR
jgi:hypothetical protein